VVALTQAIATVHAVGALVLAEPAGADDPWAREVAVQVAKDVEDERPLVAIARLEEAYAKRPLPVFLYMQAKIEEQHGDCGSAIGHYEAFLTFDVPDEDAVEAGAGLGRCREILGDDDEPSAPPDPPPDKVRQWYADPWGGVAVVFGVVGVGVGTGVLLQAQQDERAASEAQSLDAFDRHADRAELWSRAGVATLSVGLGLMVAGVIRYAVVGARQRRVRLGAGTVSVRF
jgi:hypothetical protein